MADKILFINVEQNGWTGMKLMGCRLAVFGKFRYFAV